MLTDEDITAVAIAKANDYVKDTLMKVLLESSDDPLRAIASIAKEAATECNFDDKSVDKELYDMLQKEIQHKVQRIFKQIAEQIEINQKDD